MVKDPQMICSVNFLRLSDFQCVMILGSAAFFWLCRLLKVCQAFVLARLLIRIGQNELFPSPRLAQELLGNLEFNIS